MLWMAVWELLVLAVMWWIGSIRGWSFKPPGLRPTWNSTAAGIFLFSIFVGIYWFARLLLNWVYPATPSNTQILSELTFPFLALIVVVNPIYEESFWEGYLFQSLQRHGVWVMVLTSALLRTLCHAHLGLQALVTILPMGLVYALIYWRWRQLWPLVVAHALEMLFSLMRMHYAQQPAFSASSYGKAWLIAEVAAILVCLCLGLCGRKQRALVTE